MKISPYGKIGKVGIPIQEHYGGTLKSPNSYGAQGGVPIRPNMNIGYDFGVEPIKPKEIGLKLALDEKEEIKAKVYTCRVCKEEFGKLYELGIHARSHK